MAIIQADSPFPLFTDKGGDPLDGGFVYFGEPDLNPEESPKTVYYDAALAIATPQPLRTSNGYITRNGAPAAIYSDGPFSMTVRDRNRALVFYSPRTFLPDGFVLSDRNPKDVAALLANTSLTYTAGQDGTVAAGDIIRTLAEGFAYEVAASGATDQHVTTAGGVKLYVQLEADGFFPLGAMGPDDTGATDITALVETALSASDLLQYPAGSFLQSDVSLVSRKHIRGAGKGAASETELLVGTNNAGAFLAETTSGNILDNVIENLSCKSASGVTGARFIRQTSKTNYIAYPRFLNIETWKDLEVSYDIFPIFMVMEKCRDGYFGTAPDGQTHQALRATPASYVQSKRCNLNTVRDTNFFNADNPKSAVEIAYGDQWNFVNCDFESCPTLAAHFDGVYIVNFDSCWFEQVGSAENPRIVVATLDNAPTGTRDVVFRSCYILPDSDVTQIIFLGDASRASFEDTKFIQVPTGCVISNDLPKVRRFDRSEVLSGDGDLTAGVLNKIGDAQADSALIVDLEMSGTTNFKGAIQDVAVVKTGLTDGPGSPETVATVTIPGLVEPSGQVIQVFSMDLEAIYMAVATTTTIWVYNRQKLGITMIRAKDGTVRASIVSSGNLQQAASAALSAPVWSVLVSGSDVLIQVTGNPSGGTYTNGIRASLTGTMHTANMAPSFTQPTIA